MVQGSGEVAWSADIFSITDDLKLIIIIILDILFYFKIIIISNEMCQVSEIIIILTLLIKM